jgi:hypothetical protein
LRGWVQDSHHPMGGYGKSKSQLALPPDKTTIVLIWAFKRIIFAVFENAAIHDVLYP